MLRQTLLATALALSLVACTPEPEPSDKPVDKPFDEQLSNDLSISDVTVTAVEDGAGEGKPSHAFDYTISNDTGERIWVIATYQGTFALRPDANDLQTLVLMDDFSPAETEDNTSAQPPYFDIDLVEADETLPRWFDVVGIATDDPLFDLPHMRFCVAFIRESSRSVGYDPGTIDQSGAHSLREVACSSVIPMPPVLSS